MLYGLQKANMNVFDLFLEPNDDSQQSPHSYCFKLMDSTGNYNFYRETMRARPGIPFLLPHIVEHQSHGEDAIIAMFPLCVHWKSGSIVRLF